MIQNWKTSSFENHISIGAPNQSIVKFYEVKRSRSHLSVAIESNLFGIPIHLSYLHE